MIAASALIFERYYRPVFEPVDFSAGAGELLLVTGPNGSGKTTLIRLLAGVLRPTEGEIHRDTESLAYVGHLLGIKDDLTVRENLVFMRAVAGDLDCPLDPVIRRLGLEGLESREARNLSAGQRKRCALSRLLLGSAKLWLLDEPYSNLDNDGQTVVDTMLKDHLDQGGTCIMSTHGQLRPANLESRELQLKPGGME